jgi:RHS repeat-associated protein
VPGITNFYDNRDWPTRVLDPLQQATIFTNDAAGRLVSATDPLQRTERYGYDSDGRRTTITNAAQEVVVQQWSARGDLTKLTDNATHTVSRTFDGNGNQILLTNRNGKKWQFQFDGANRLTNMVTPLNRQTSQTWDNRGLLQSVHEPSTNVANFYFDARKRLTNRTDGVGTTLYAYDANNNRTHLTEGTRTNGWAYDAYDRVSSYQDADGNVIQYSYDTSGNLTNLMYPGNRSVSYYYDSLNRLTNVTDWSSRTTTYTYDLANRIKAIARPNGTTRMINYDSAGETTNVVEEAASRAPIAFFKMNYDSAARMRWEFAGPTPHSYTLPIRGMTFDDDNRLITFGGQNVTNDLDGNMTWGPLTNNTFSGYIYDARNRLLSAGGLNYAYDAAGSRIAVTNGANVTKFVINPESSLPQVLMRVRNGVTNYYVYGLGLLYEVTETSNSTNMLTYHFDYRGSTVALTDANGNITDRIEYSVYGTTTFRAGTNDTPFLFNGRYGVMTDANGLLFMRARYYNPYICRFLNPDPAGFAGGLNWYAYADGNPVSFVDPFGLYVGADDAIAMGGGALIGLAAQGIGDLLHGHLSSWQHYVAAAVGGAAGGEATLYTGPGGGLLVRATVSGAVSGFMGNVTRQGLDIATGRQKDFDWSSTATETTLGGAFGLGGGYVFSKTVPWASRLLSEEGGGVPSLGYCFPKGTKVETPLGKVNIEDIQVGDKVLSFDFGQGKVLERTVTRLVRKLTEHWYKITVGANVIKVTGAHPFWVANLAAWVSAHDLKPGMEFEQLDGNLVEITSVEIESLAEPEGTYNFEVEHDHNYFAGTTDCTVLAHNTDPYDINYSRDPALIQGSDTFEHGDWAGRTLDEAVAEARSLGQLPEGLTLNASWVNDTMVAANNRTLWVAQQAGLQNVSVSGLESGSVAKTVMTHLKESGGPFCPP